MTDDFERDLRRLMADTAPATSDDAFVERVSGEVHRRRRLHATWRGLVAMGLFLTALTAAPYFTEAMESVALVSGLVTIPVSAALATPSGWAVSGLAAIWLLIRTTFVASGRRRRVP